MVAFGGKNGKWLGGLVKSATLHGFSVSSVGGDPKVEFGGGLVGNDYSSAQLTPSHGLYDFPTSGLLGEKTRGTLSAGYPNSYFAGGGWDMGDYVVQRNGSGDKISPSARWGMNSIMQSNPYMTVVNKQRVI
ncbi:MAG: hypothetical protein ACSHXZ_10020 [Gammaproteobacteria bacterium]